MIVRIIFPFENLQKNMGNENKIKIDKTPVCSNFSRRKSLHSHKFFAIQVAVAVLPVFFPGKAEHPFAFPVCFEIP